MQGIQLNSKLFHLNFFPRAIFKLPFQCTNRAITNIPITTTIRSTGNLIFKRNYSDWKKVNEDFETLALSDCSTTEQQIIQNHGVAPISTSAFFIMDNPVSSSDASRANEPEKRYEYSRIRNPTRDNVEIMLSKLEGAKYTRTFGSGMAAISSIISLLHQGDHIVSIDTIYNGTYVLLNEYKNQGISIDYTKSIEVEEIIKLVKENTKLIILESQVNPTLGVVDISELVKHIRNLPHGNDIIIAVDNTFLTPIFSRPLELGVDLVVHSCTKYLGGHGDIIMGSVSTNSQELLDRVQSNQIKFGAIPSPFDCYLLIRSLRTLPLRMKQHSKNGLQVAEFLERHPMVDRVLYTGLKSHPQHHIAKKQQFGDAGMIGFYIKGDFETAVTFLESIKIFKMAPSLGTYCSLASLPARLSHHSLSKNHKDESGILENFIRLSVGLENADTLNADLDQALRSASTKL